jgi:hypothetical protein
MAVAAALVLAVGCAGVGRRSKADKLDASLAAYNSAIRWGQFEDAVRLCAPVKGQPPPVDDKLRHLRVTGAEEKQRSLAEDGAQATATVEYEFYDEYQARVNKVVDHQRWRYDDQAGRWLLQDCLAAFQPHR